jgi:hypothetical protein
LDNVTGYYLSVNNTDHDGILGGSWGPKKGTPVQLYDCVAGPAYESKYVRFDGVTFHDAIQTSSNSHLECFQTQGGDHITVRDSLFTNCAQWDISISAASTTIENNVMAHTCSNQGAPCAPGAAIVISCSYGGQPLGDWTIRFNSMHDAFMQFNSPGSGCSRNYGRRSRMYGNIIDGWAMNDFICSTYQGEGWTLDYNIYASGSCGPHDASAGSQFGDATQPTYDFHLANCSVKAADFVPTSVTGGYPAVDYAGVTRPHGGAVDAGAYEDCPTNARSPTTTPATSTTARHAD